VATGETPAPWEQRLTERCDDLAPQGSDLRSFVDANVEAIHEALTTGGGKGARMVVNLSAANVPKFCEAALKKDPKPYKNCYDLEQHRVGEQHRRVLVDESLPVNASYEHVYFGAADLNGIGVRFYGDFCFVLNESEVRSNTVILDRNSYDLDREPLRSKIEAAGRRDEQDNERRRVAKDELSGTWAADLKFIVGLKMLDRFARRLRRLTTGEISDGVLDDEDYVEVLWTNRITPQRSFGPRQLAEARISPADVALEGRIDARARAGPVCDIAELVWRDGRRDAEAALREVGVPIRVVTTAGRVK
jgi:hypothetical protein